MRRRRGVVLLQIPKRVLRKKISNFIRCVKLPVVHARATPRFFVPFISGLHHRGPKWEKGALERPNRVNNALCALFVVKNAVSVSFFYEAGAPPHEGNVVALKLSLGYP